MSGVLRLDAIPITDLPQLVKSDPGEPASTNVNCVLHCGPLPVHQYLEVSVNGVLQQSVAEGDQTVFSWQLAHASDDVRITLFKNGVMMKHWQGCWNERDAILHLGTLPVQVFFNGKRQPLVVAMHPAAEGVNGNGQHIILSTSDHAQQASLEVEREQQQQREVVMVQDLFVIAEPKQSALIVQHDVIDDEEEGKDHSGEMMEEDEDMIEDESDEADENEEYDLIVAQEEQQVVDDATATRPRLAAFHANPIASEKILGVLKELVESMPPKTIIVDLRRHSRTKKRDQGQGKLSKDLLRATFGGKYWDRGWAIQTNSHPVPATEKHSSRWRHALVDPDRHPDGVASLITSLQAGYSLIVMDSLASYAESPRKAVIEELQQHVSHLMVGPIG